VFGDLLRWWLVVQALGLLALPLTWWFFRRLPDRGYSFAKPLGLLLTGYGAWLLAMIGLGALGWLKLALIALGIGAGGAALLGRVGLRSALHELRLRSGWIVFHEALFIAALGGAIWLRWHGIWGLGVAINHTEMPMDLAFLSGILASPQFPPQDPWLANYPINYYYLGYLLVAALIRLSGVTIGVGYTLGIATIFALTATGVAGIVRNLIELAENREQRTENGEPEPESHSRSSIRNQAPKPGAAELQRYVFPLLGVLFVLIAGNQAGALQVLAGSEKVVALEPAQLARAVSNGLGARQTIDISPFPVDDFDRSPQITPSDKAANFDAWWPSRATWDDLTGDDGQVRRVYNITEFPFFSFFLGDLHPHVLSLPWTLLAVALALNVLVQPRALDHRTRAGALRLVITGIVLGGLYAINSWDLPTYLLLYLGALTLLYLRLAGSPRQFFWAHFIQQAGLTILASYFAYVLFHMTFVAPTEGFPLALSPVRTGLVELLVIFGLFLVPLLVLLAHTALRFRPADDPTTQAIWPLGGLPTLLGIGVVLLLGIVAGWPGLALLPLALYALLLAYARRDHTATSFALTVFALGALVLWGTDLVYLRDHFAGSLPRMNTIFKFYYQVWLLWGTLAAFALWALLQRIRPTTALWLAPWALLLAGALVYPALAPADQAPQYTLDGLAYLQTEQPGEAAAIDWIKQNTPGDALVLQAPGDSYRHDSARIASATGRPTLIGWPGSHEGLWRRGQPDVSSQIEPRVQDARTIYTTTDAAFAQSLLARYDVDYVYVGPRERTLIAEEGAPPEALAKFDGMMQRVFERDGVIVYQMP
jgi:YYY domain-containing protein